MSRIAGLRSALGAVVFLAATTLLSAAVKAGPPEGIRFTDLPPWVDEASVAGIAVPEPNEGLSYLLVDDQVSLRGREPEDFRRLVYDVRDRSGLEEGGRLSISFQPDFQRVEIHSLMVHRGGRSEDRRDDSRIEILRTEDRADDGILDGWRSAEVLIPDIEVGDRVELAFTVIGDNPVFAGRYHTRLSAAYSQAVGMRRVRFLEGRDRLSYAEDSAVDYRVSDSRDGGGRVLELVAKDLKSIVSEGLAPEWFDGYGAIEVASTPDWADVASWSTRLFERSASAKAVLGEKGAELGLKAKSPEEALLAALGFVQSEIRYVSLSIGESSHAPASPEVTLKRRFGDCKDKSSLLVGLLEHAGIEAQPVLVNTQRGPRLPEGLPSTGAFDHAIVRARIDGAWVYVDPTRWVEYGPLAEREPVRFAWGLPVSAGTKALEPIPVDGMDRGRFAVDVEQRMAVEGEGDGERVKLDVVTTYVRGSADPVRANFAGKGAEAVGRDYLDYMRGMYRDMVAVDAPAMEDDREKNRVVVAEAYRTPMVVGEEAEGGGKSISLKLFQIDDWIPEEDAPERAWPLALGGPERGRHAIVFPHTAGWTIEDEHHVVENDWFRFERNVSLEGDELRIVGTWERFAEHVPAESYAGIRDDLQEVRDLLVYPVSFGSANVSTVSVHHLAWTLLALVVLAATLLFAWQARHRSAVAGMLFEPRATIASRIDRDALGPALIWVLAAGAAGLLIEVVPDAFAGNDVDWRKTGMEFARAIPHQAFVVGVLWLGLRLTGVKSPYRQLFVSGAWAGIPIVLFVPLALLAAAGASAAIADPASTLDGPTWVIALTSAVGLGLLLAGLVWAIVTGVIAYAVAAGCSARRIIAIYVVLSAIFVPIIWIAVS